VRGILFDKVAGKNWALGWHQDTKIAVNTHRPDLEGFTGWSEKEGIVHTLPPREVLEAGLALRLHLDPCPADNGPLQVIPFSHLNGVREAPTDDEITTAETLVAEAGDVFWMRPLVFHGSPKAERVGHRRVLHLEYSAAKLPEGLNWAWPLEIGLS
jgi:ectoine hydroxylase-related dioxygenase (phytanoyl-CoA dioxygenase family)